jgi:hypothetical protein
VIVGRIGDDPSDNSTTRGKSMFKSLGSMTDALLAKLIRSGGVDFRRHAPRFRFDCVHIHHGEVIDEFYAENLVTIEGGKDLLTQYFKGSAYTAANYLGLISGASYTSGPTSADTAANLSGVGNSWAECSATYAPNYSTPSGTNRGALSGNWGTPTTADPVVLARTGTVDFTFSGTGTVKGAFIAGGATRLSTTAPLYSAALFSGDKTISSVGDQLLVTVSVSIDVG